MNNPNFIIPKLPMSNMNYSALLQKIVLANRKIVEYNTFIQTIPNPNILLSTLTMHEALLSSRIEGTQATLEEVVEYQDSLQEKNQNFADIQEVINYRKALMFAVEKIKTSPLSLLFIKEIHKILLNGVRGANKDRGSFRKIQNWIGKP